MRNSTRKRITQTVALMAGLAVGTWIAPHIGAVNADAPFNVMETTIADVHKAYKSGKLTAHQLTQMYLDRIAAYDQKGPTINCVITLNPKALEEADSLDAAFKKGGFVGPLHGVPMLFKDQIDVAGIRT